MSTYVEEHARTTRLGAVARRQHGVFTLAQALDAGYSRPTVRRRLERVEWIEVVPRAYYVALGPPPSWRAETLAHALSSGGAACRCSALALHGLLAAPDEPQTITVRNRRTLRRGPAPSTDCLPAADLTVVDSIPTTTVARTLIDVAGLLPRPLVEDLLDRAIVQRLVTANRLRARATALWAPRRNGCAIVLELLDARDPGLHRAANLWEAKVSRIVRRLGLPEPQRNYRVRIAGRVRYLDLAWPESRVAVEFDGFVPHSSRRVFDDDRARQNDLVADGSIVFRVTATMLRDEQATFGPIAAAVLAKR